MATGARTELGRIGSLVGAIGVRRLAWPIVFVSLLFVAGAFGIFDWALDRALPVQAARTMQRCGTRVIAQSVLLLRNPRTPRTGVFCDAVRKL